MLPVFYICFKSFNQLVFHARRMCLQSIGHSGPFGEVPQRGKKKEKKVLEVSLLDDWHIALLLMLGDLDDL